MDFAGFLASHQHITGPVLVLLMVAESAPVTGFLVPGTLLLPAIGVISGSGNSPFIYLYVCAVSGGLLGDLAGYWLGGAGKREWQLPFLLKHRQDKAAAARALVKRHGGLAVFMGRFIWLIHPAIPVAAGLAGVRFRTFLVADTAAVSLWVLLYMGSGHLLTGLWVSFTGG